MLLWRILPALLALPAALAAKDAFTQLSELAKASKGGPIKLDTKLFEVITSPQRTWSAAIQFTAMDKRRRCSPCREFEPSWNAVAKAWAQTPKEDRDQHFFATVDFDEAPAVFTQLGLQSAPVVYVYPPTQGPRQSSKNTPFKYDFSYGFDPEPLAQSLSNHTPIPIPYKAPFNWAGWLTGLIGLVSFAMTLRFILPVLQSRWTWGIITIFTSLIMTSGHMFTRIRGVPYTAANGNWIANGYQNMYGQEVHVIAMIYGVLAFSFLMQILVIPRQMSANRQRLQVYLWSAVIMFIYSVLVTIFRVKNRGYPFRLLL